MLRAQFFQGPEEPCTWGRDGLRGAGAALRSRRSSGRGTIRARRGAEVHWPDVASATPSLEGSLPARRCFLTRTVPSHPQSKCLSDLGCSSGFLRWDELWNDVDGSTLPGHLLQKICSLSALQFIESGCCRFPPRTGICVAKVHSGGVARAWFRVARSRYFPQGEPSFRI